MYFPLTSMQMYKCAVLNIAVFNVGTACPFKMLGIARNGFNEIFSWVALRYVVKLSEELQVKIIWEVVCSFNR